MLNQYQCKYYRNNETTPFVLSVIIPCFNEEATLKTCVKRLIEIESDDTFKLEIVIVDDGSSDKSRSIISELDNDYPQVTSIFHVKNQGKGAAISSGIGHVTGDFVCIQDADLEYDPRDLKCLLGPLVENKADVVFGSRFTSNGPHRVLYFWHYMGNKFLTFLSNMFTDLNLTDMETCYKVFRRSIIQKITIREKRFGFEPEIVAKIAHQDVRVYEMGISYHGRTYKEGKKIGMKDGFKALYCIFRYNVAYTPFPVRLITAMIILFPLFVFVILNFMK
ncbi:Glycosyl transferase, family 2 [Chitinispirillum alkaliphilum]|nr:Glycosyl transferase, family 2 [Chitinispirillum alkaliphilum]